MRYILLLLVLPFLFISCNDEEVEDWTAWVQSGQQVEQPKYISCCYQNALFACAIIGDYFEEYEVVTTAGHSECRVYIDNKMYYVKLCGSVETGYGIKLQEKVIANISDIRFIDDLVSYSRRVIIWQDMKRDDINK